MSLSSGKIIVVCDGPGIMVLGAPLILGLRSAGYEVWVSVSQSAGLFTTQFSPALLTGHGGLSWPLPEEALQGCKAILFAPCSMGWFKALREGEEGRRLVSHGMGLLVAPAVLPTEDEQVWQELAEAGSSDWRVIPSMGNMVDMGALGTLKCASVELCVESIRRWFCPQDFAGCRVLITAGPTAEDADPVRYVTNRSTGRMGVALAEVAARRGAEVTVVHGPMSCRLPEFPGVHGVSVRSAAEMYDEVMARVADQDVAILCAAVADYTPVTYSDIKIKKGSEATFALLLKRTPDILASVGQLPKHPYLVGFAAESDHVEENARGKLRGKNCDLLCANDVMEAGSGFGVNTNRVTVFARDGQVHRLPQMSKVDVSRKVLDFVAEGLEERASGGGDCH